jgi:hypothetical protein
MFAYRTYNLVFQANFTIIKEVSCGFRDKIKEQHLSFFHRCHKRRLKD